MEVRWHSEKDMIRDMNNRDFNEIITLRISFCKINLTILPPKLKSLHCSHNKLISLPDLPKTLEYLYCGNNQLTSLPKLPDGLQELYCEKNKLTSLSLLPNSLIRLDCCHNKLTSLPLLPKNLKYLNCGYNKLTYCYSQLPNKLRSFVCFGNLIDVCKDLENELINASIDSDYFDLIANKISIFNGEICELQNYVDSKNKTYNLRKDLAMIGSYRRVRDKILGIANNIMSHYEIVL